MAIRKIKPTTPGQRFMTVSGYEEITCTTPEKSLLEDLRHSGGRNNAGRILAIAHLVEDLEVALGIGISRGARRAGLLGNAAVLLPLVLRQVAAIGLPAANQLLGDLEHRVKHVRRVVEAGLARIALAGPLEAEPVDVLLDVLGVLVGLLGRIRVVESEVALAIKELGHAEVNADGLGVSDMNVAVRFRRETRNNLAAGLALGNVLFNPLTEKMTRSI